MAEPSDLAFRTATELASLLARRDISAGELLDLAISRIEALDPKVPEPKEPLDGIVIH